MLQSLNDDEINFLKDWFKVGEHQFGQYRNIECNNVDDILKFIFDCKENKEPAFSSISPYNTIHKFFWEFDNDDVDVENCSYDMSELDSLWDEATKVAMNVLNYGGKPIIVYSGRRGFHVWANIKAIVFAPENEKEGRKLYKEILFTILGDPDDYPHFDRHPTSVNSMARIPFSWHQKTGNQAIPLNILRKPYIPDVMDFYRSHFKEDFVKDKLHLLRQRASQQSKKEQEMPKTDYGDRIVRQCIIRALEKDPSHNARLAYLLDAIYAGYTDARIHEDMKNFGRNDYDYDKTQYQIEFARGSVKDGMKPVSNETLKRWGIYIDTITIWEKK